MVSTHCDGRGSIVLTFDHIAVAAETLDDGAAWAEARLGVPLQPGGAHAVFKTHNRLLGLGDLYLEVIAPQPGETPDRPRWFGLDHVTGPPRLVNWICATKDITAACAAGPADLGTTIDLARGHLRWKITVPEDGSLPFSGAYPTLLQWGQGVAPPAESLPDSGCRLQRFEITTPNIDIIRSYPMPDDPRVVLRDGPATTLHAVIRTPTGDIRL